MNTDAAYFDQNVIWGQSPEPYQLQVTADILSLLPKAVRTVLDVGCGDGIVTNAIGPQYDVTGVDLSEAALSHVRRPHRVASITQLPFADGSFDLVMSNDVLEHLEEADFAEALKELARVASRYILITVPNAELLAANSTKCLKCGQQYHLNHHRRSMGADVLRGLFGDKFRPVEVRYSGDQTRTPPEMTIGLRHALGWFQRWDKAICPECGSSKQASPAEDVVLRSLESLRSARWARWLRQGYVCNHRTETIALFARHAQPRPRPAAVKAVKRSSLLRVDFANPNQVAIPDITPGSTWARFVRPPSVQQDGDGVRLSGEAAGPAVIPVWFPVEARAGDKILVEASGTGEIRVAAADGVTGLREVLHHQSLTPARTAMTIAVADAWRPDRFGLPVEIELAAGVALHSIEYQCKGSGSHLRKMIRLKTGHNVVPLGVHGGVCHSWGFVAPGDGDYPLPTLVVSEKSIPVVGCTELFRILRDAHDGLGRRYRDVCQLPQLPSSAAPKNAFNGCRAERLVCLEGKGTRSCPDLYRLVEIKEQQRHQAELAYSASLAEYHAVHRQLLARCGIRGATKELLRSTKHVLAGPSQPLKEHYPPPWKDLNAKAADNKGRKVLIISHMFPHPDQPMLGPFVLEQVKALREHAGIDARVIVGRPFWMNLRRRPWMLWRRHRQYKAFYKTCTWRDLHGVPVLYLPYQILFGFWHHERTYSSALLGRIDEVRDQFPFTCVHAHSSYLDGSVGWQIARRFGVPLIITEHMNPFSILTDDPRVRRRTVQSLEAADRVIGVSQVQRDSVLPWMAPQSADRLIVLPNGVDMKLFQPSPNRRRNPTAPRLLYVGHFADYKNLPLLVEAMARLLVRLPQARLRLIGSGATPEEEAAIKRLVVQRGIQDNVEFLGQQSREAVARIMREKSDMLVLASRTESFGCVLIEAMACGLPVVSTRSGGPEDIVTDPFLGRLCENFNPDALAEAMFQVASQLHSFDAQRIHRHVAKHFSYRSLALKLAELYGDLTSQRGTERREYRRAAG